MLWAIPLPGALGRNSGKLKLKEDPMSFDDRLEAVKELIGEADLFSEAISPEERETYKIYTRELEKGWKESYRSGGENW